MQPLNQEVRHLFRVVDSGGDAVTGLVTGNFTLTLQRESSGDLVAASETVTVAEIDSGDYWVTYTPTAGIGVYYLTIAHATHYVGPDSFQVDVGSGYAGSTGTYLSTRANVKSALNITGTDDDSRIDELLAAVTDWAQNFCSRAFFSATYTELKCGKGHGATTINLDEYPVTSITSVHESTDEPRVYDSTTLLTADSEYICDLGEGILHRLGSCWSRCPQAIQVVYVAGYATIPSRLERAAIEVIASKLPKAKFMNYHWTSASHGGDGFGGLRDEDIPPHAMRVFRAERGMRAA